MHYSVPNRTKTFGIALLCAIVLFSFNNACAQTTYSGSVNNPIAFFEASLVSFFDWAKCNLGFGCVDPSSTVQEPAQTHPDAADNSKTTVDNQPQEMKQVTIAPPIQTSETVKPISTQTEQPQTIQQIIQPTKEIQTIHTVSTNTQTVVADQDLRDQVARILRQLDSDRPNYSVGQSASLPSNLVGKTLNINSSNLTIADDGTLTSRGALSIAGLTTLQGGISLPSAVPVVTTSSLYNDNGDLKWNGSTVGLSSSISGTVGYLSKFLTGSTIGDSVLYESTGKVGIGTTNPLSKFDVRGGINAGANGTEFVLTDAGIITAGTWNGTAIDVSHGGTGTTTGSITGTGALTFSAGGTNQNVALIPSGTGYTLLGGNVGIGTTAPTEKLDISFGNINLKNEPGPETSLTATVSSEAGNLSGYYRYRVAFVTNEGETEPNYSIAVASPSNQKVDLTNIPVGSSNVISRRIYRNQAGDNSGTLKLVTTISDNVTTTFTDNTADNLLGEILYPKNSTGGVLKLNGGSIFQTNSLITIAGKGAALLNYGVNNTVFGTDSLHYNTSGFSNSALGFKSLYSNTTGYSNSAFGNSSLYSNTTGYWNTAVGGTALYSNTTGYMNVASGGEVLYANTSGMFNVGVGADALRYNTEGSSNAAVGTYSLFRNTIGNDNAAFGRYSLDYNTIGNYNIALGGYSLHRTVSGSNNVAVGYNSGRGVSNNSFSNNSLFGYQSGYGLSTGSNNLLLGYQSGDNLTTGGNNIVIGYDIDAPSATSANTLNIGNLIYATGLDGTGTTLSTGNVGIGTTAPGAKLTLNGGNFQHIAAGNPTLKGSLSGKGYGVYVSGKYVFIAAGNLGFKIVDVSNPASPVTISSNSFAAVADIYVSGKYAYVADGASGLRIEDISNPKSPNLIATIATTGANGVYVSGKYAYVADLAGGLRVIDVSNPASPALAGTNALSNANGVYVSGKYAYVADGAAGLRIVDVTNPAAMTVAGTYNTPDSATRVYVSGKYAYVADGSSLQIIDVSDPTSPVLAGSYSSAADYYTGVYVSGKYAYVASGSDFDDGSGLRVIDVSVPATTTLVGAYNTVSYGVSLYVSGKYAYLTTSSSTRMVDISGIETPSLYAGNIQTNGITITENANIANDLYVRGGGDFGGLTLFQNGFFSSADSFFSGNVGIGVTSAATKLQVLGDIRTGTSGTNGCVQGFGGASIAGTCSSDSNLKVNVNYLGNILDRFVQIKPATFQWNETAQALYKNSADAINYGIIAQDLEQLFPELVATDSNGYKMVNYSALNIYALEAIKEQQAEINNLKLTLGIDGSIDSTSTVDAFNAAAAEQGNIVAIVKNALANLGMVLENGAASVRELFAEKIKTNEITIKKINIIDSISGETYCTWLENGEWVKTKGACGQPAASPVPPVSSAGNGNSDSGSDGTNKNIGQAQPLRNGTSTDEEGGI